MRRFFASPENIGASEITLSADESRHLRDVLRLQTGEFVAVFDGGGREFSCKIKGLGSKKDSAVLAVIGEIPAPAPESKLDLTLAVALLKGEKFDLVVQKATELGVKKIVPLETKRADVRLKDNRDTGNKIERWRRIAFEAAKQSGRAFVPVVDAPISFADFVVQSSDQNSRILFTERGGAKIHQILQSGVNSLTAIIGSEGGWDDDELKLAAASQIELLTFGGRILRAETAAIAAAAILQFLRGDMC